MIAISKNVKKYLTPDLLISALLPSLLLPVLLLAACSTVQNTDEDKKKNHTLTPLQSEQAMASRALLAIKEAEPDESSRLATRLRKNGSDHIASTETSMVPAHTDELPLPDMAQIAVQNEKATETILTPDLGGLFFASYNWELKRETEKKLATLTAFLAMYEDRTAIIAGYTDNIGSEKLNLDLSQRRAESVKLYLTSHGIAESRLGISGRGESNPVANNHSAKGRQLNRRVEVIIAGKNTAAK